MKKHHANATSSERARYFQVPGAHLFTVLHESADPVARILLVGPFASERQYSYIPWVRWARYLSEKQIEVLRYDYRGVGESTGVFEDMTFETWSEDVKHLAEWLKNESPPLPLILHGLEMGAILAAREFHTGTGDALLLWAPPANANQALRATLMRRVRMDQLFKYGHDRKTLADYIRQIERGPFLEVEGYQWSDRLWCDSFKLELPSGMVGDGSPDVAYNRPVRIVGPDKLVVPLVKGGSAAPDSFNKDFSPLFARNCEWIITFLATLTWKQK